MFKCKTTTGIVCYFNNYDILSAFYQDKIDWTVIPYRVIIIILSFTWYSPSNRNIGMLYFIRFKRDRFRKIFIPPYIEFYEKVYPMQNITGIKIRGESKLDNIDENSFPNLKSLCLHSTSCPYSNIRHFSKMKKKFPKISRLNIGEIKYVMITDPDLSLFYNLKHLYLIAEYSDCDAVLTDIKSDALKTISIELAEIIDIDRYDCFEFNSCKNLEKITFILCMYTHTFSAYDYKCDVISILEHYDKYHNKLNRKIVSKLIYRDQ